MKKIALAIILATYSFCANAQTSKSDTIAAELPKWEYETIYVMNSHMYAKQGEVEFKALKKKSSLDDYGKQGWELVSVTPIIASNFANGRVYTQSLCYIFKRRIIEPKK